MNNNFYKVIATAMNIIEKHSINKIYLLNPDIETKAYNLYSSFTCAGIKAIVEYIPAYLQVVVIADCTLLDIHTNVYKQELLNADAICIDTTSEGMLHIECIFNNAFRKAGVLNE